LIVIFVFTTCHTAFGANMAKRPNIIIIFTDDHGYADLSCQGVRNDIKTPNTDKLATEGVRFTAGYCSAPQCRPSRAGLLTGRYQNRFGLEQNGDAGLPWSERTIAERLADAGYVTGMSGKWHLDGAVGSNGDRPDGTQGKRIFNKAGKYTGNRLKNPGLADGHGFQEYLCGSRRTYVATHDAKGESLGGKVIHNDDRFRIDVQAEWAANFISRHAAKEKPFFLYVPFFAPHVPLEAPEKYLKRFPGKMPRRRRLALAMLSAVDDGVGLIRKSLDKKGVTENTLIFYISDNGAPLKLHKIDAPGGGPGWDGSLNDPWLGEKGMLTEGGIRVPFIACWPARIPRGKVYQRPVITFDATATALAAAGLKRDKKLDGVDLVSFLTGKSKGDPHDALYWRWVGQAAIREGDWKYLQGAGRGYLFDLSSDLHEKKNLIAMHPEQAAKLRKKLQTWSQGLMDPGPKSGLSRTIGRNYDHYLDGKPARRPVTPSKEKPGKKKPGKRPVRDLETLFKRRDTNKDGFLTLKEFIGNPKGRNVPGLNRVFKSRDINNDSKLTLKELKNR
jgi:arylsulfatase A-like enzyme